MEGKLSFFFPQPSFFWLNWEKGRDEVREMESVSLYPRHFHRPVCYYHCTDVLQQRGREGPLFHTFFIPAKKESCRHAEEGREEQKTISFTVVCLS